MVTNLNLTDQHSMTDDESTSYLDSESETINKSDEYIEEYNPRYKILDNLSSFKILVPGFGCLLFILSYFLWGIPVYDEHIDIHFGHVFLFSGSFFIISILLGILFDSISMWYLKRSKGSASYCYYFNELSFHISSFLVLFIVNLFLIQRYENDFYILDFFKIKLYVLYSLKLIIFAIIILGLLKTAVKYVSMRFNYNMYIEDIRKCIISDMFVSLISNAREDEDGERLNVINNLFRITSPNNAFILQKRFRIDDATQLSFEEKRLLIKEFLNLENRDKMYSGTLPVVLGKIRDKANSRANKLVKKLRRHHKIKKIRDVSRYFSDQETFKYVLNQLKIQAEEPIEKENISDILEKSYKNKYVIKKNLEQINSAIQRVSFATKLFIYLITVIFILISASLQIDYFTGILSGIFGTQFISKILSDNVLQSIIFLFVIHPFDIGDRVFIRIGGVVENLVVAELNIFSTTFYRFDGTSFFVPNSLMINTHISNIRRSGNIMETHTIQVDSTTKPIKLEKLREKLIAFCRANPLYYTDYILVNYDSIENCNKLYINILMQYHGNFQNYDYYLKRRSAFVRELGFYLKELKIEYSLPIQKVTVVEKI